jgi:hypothetical protein
MVGEQIFLTKLGRKSHQLLHGRLHRLPGSRSRPGNKNTVPEMRRTFLYQAHGKIFRSNHPKYIYT